jgi:hypothetical protein
MLESAKVLRRMDDEKSLVNSRTGEENEGKKIRSRKKSTAEGNKEGAVQNKVGEGREDGMKKVLAAMWLGKKIMIDNRLLCFVVIPFTIHTSRTLCYLHTEEL